MRSLSKYCFVNFAWQAFFAEQHIISVITWKSECALPPHQPNLPAYILSFSSTLRDITCFDLKGNVTLTQLLLWRTDLLFKCAACRSKCCNTLHLNNFLAVIALHLFWRTLRSRACKRSCPVWSEMRSWHRCLATVSLLCVFSQLLEMLTNPGRANRGYSSTFGAWKSLNEQTLFFVDYRSGPKSFSGLLRSLEKYGKRK